MIEQHEHGLVVADLLVPSRVIRVMLFGRDLLEHGGGKEVDAGVIFDKAFTFFDHGVVFVGVGVDFGDYAIQPVFVNAVVCGKPLSGTGEYSV